MRNWKTLVIFFILSQGLLPSQTFSWVKLRDSNPAKHLEEKAVVSQKMWILSKLGAGKFNPQGSIFNFNLSTELPQATIEDATIKPGDFTVTLQKQAQLLTNHLFDYIISNNRTRHRLLYFSKIDNPNEKKLCALRDVGPITDENFAEALFDNCYYLEFSKIFAKHNPKSLKQIEWNAKQLFKQGEDPGTYETLVSLKKDRNGYSYQRLRTAFDSSLLSVYLLNIMAFEAKNYERSDFFYNRTKNALQTLPYAGLTVLSLLGLVQLKTLFFD